MIPIRSDLTFGFNGPDQTVKAGKGLPKATA